jgi:hypothetical protein
MLMVKIMRPPVKSRETACLEAVAGLAGLSVSLCVCLPEFRYHNIVQSILLSLGAIASVTAVGWLAARSIKVKSPLPAFGTTASFTTFHPGSVNQYKTPDFGTILPPAGFDREPSVAEKLRSLDRFQFVKIIELIFQTRGFWVKQLGTPSREGTVDLIIESTAETLAVQCKDSRAWTVGVRQIGEFEANLLNHRIQKGVFVTLTGCTADAKQLARKNGIQILEEADILEMLVESGLVYDHRIAGLLADELVQN